MLFTNNDTCCQCYGSGKVYGWDDVLTDERVMVMCQTCLGTGEQLTDIGKELIAFLAQHYDLKLKSQAKNNT